MAETTRPSLERRQRPLADLPEELVSEILLRLPPKSILQCRCVCKAWHRIASDCAFPLAHQRRQPLRRLLFFVRDLSAHDNDLEVLDYCVEALDHRTHEFRSVVRFTGNDFDFDDDIPLAVHATCDGLLLMSYRNSLHL